MSLYPYLSGQTNENFFGVVVLVKIVLVICKMCIIQIDF